MNQRKAKQLRKMAKTLVDRQTEYKEYDLPHYQNIGFTYVKVKKGTPCKMTKNCTRSVYKKLKRES